jgi:hypothetical protein
MVAFGVFSSLAVVLDPGVEAGLCATLCWWRPGVASTPLTVLASSFR